MAGMARLQIDSWDVEYGVPEDSGALGGRVETDCEVEVAADEWAPQAPPPQAPPGRIAFVDGVQRVFARGRAVSDPELPGVAAVVMGLVAGASLRGPGMGDDLRHVERRGCLVSSAEVERLDTAIGGFEFLGTKDNTDRALRNAMFNAMTRLENPIPEKLAQQADLIVQDGRLQRLHPRENGDDPPPQLPFHTLGYIKQQRRQYLEERQAGRLAA